MQSLIHHVHFNIVSLKVLLKSELKWRRQWALLYFTQGKETGTVGIHVWQKTINIIFLHNIHTKIKKANSRCTVYTQWSYKSFGCVTYVGRILHGTMGRSAVHQLLQSACQNFLGQDTEHQIAPYKIYKWSRFNIYMGVTANIKQ